MAHHIMYKNLQYATLIPQVHLAVRQAIRMTISMWKKAACANESVNITVCRWLCACEEAASVECVQLRARDQHQSLGCYWVLPSLAVTVCICTLCWLNRCQHHPGFKLMMPTAQHNCGMLKKSNTWLEVHGVEVWCFYTLISNGQRCEIYNQFKKEKFILPPLVVSLCIS